MPREISEDLCWRVIYLFMDGFSTADIAKKRNLAAKPAPWRINLLLYLAHAAWKLIRKQVIMHFNKCKIWHIALFLTY